MERKSFRPAAATIAAALGAFAGLSVFLLYGRSQAQSDQLSGSYRNLRQMARGVSRSVPPAPQPQGIPALAIANFAKVTPAYYRGGQPDEQDLGRLARMGIKTVIDLRGEDPNAIKWERKLCHSLGMGFISIPISGREAPPEGAVEKFLAQISDPLHQPDFVHCLYGRDRTGLMTAIMRLVDDCWTPERAYREMRRFGYNNPGDPVFQTYLFGYLNAHPQAAAACAARRK